MTVSTFDEVSSLGLASTAVLPINVSKGTQPAESVASPVTSSLGEKQGFEVMVRDLASLLRKQSYVDISTIRQFIEWFVRLPVGLPRPFVAIGDDGELACEWDVDGSHLHLTFFPEDAEVYFCDSQDEWETYLSHSSGKITAALRAIATAARKSSSE